MDSKTDEVLNENQVEIVVDPIVKQLNSMTELIDNLSKISKSLTLEMKVLAKDVNKLRVSKGGKKQKKPVNPDEPRKLGALEKPVSVSDELCEFLNLNKGEMYSRQTITKEINNFVKTNDLQNPENRRYILLESEVGLRLKKLLRDPDQPLTFFNIQRYLKPHYPKLDTPEVSLEVPKKKVKTVVNVEDSGEVPSEVPPEVPPEVLPKVPSEVPSEVVKDDAVVDETVEEVPKKKVVKKVVKKVSS